MARSFEYNLTNTIGRLINLSTGEDSPKVGKFNYPVEGIVIDTDDPMQQGRLRIVCPSLGDSDTGRADAVPWSVYASPFGGAMNKGTRGVYGATTKDSDLSTYGNVGYGMWAIPKVGAIAYVMCINGDPNHRIWFACKYVKGVPHTMPHGRYTVKQGGTPGGPFSSKESEVNPLFGHQTTTFTQLDEDNGPVLEAPEARESKEWRTRGADFGVSAVTEKVRPQTNSSLSDDQDEGADGFVYRSGYYVSRQDATVKKTKTYINLDSQTYSFTTPGFHAISMCDRHDHSRIRIRTTTGHQVILDDTNERIYINTNDGNNWIELDSNGNIDVYSSRRISFSSPDFNFTGKTFRVHMDEIHLYSKKQTRLHSGVHGTAGEGQISLRAGESINIAAYEAGASVHIKSQGDTLIHSESNFHLKTDLDIITHSDGNQHEYVQKSRYALIAENENLYVNGHVYNTTLGNYNIHTDRNTLITSTKENHFRSKGLSYHTGKQIHLNGPKARVSSTAVEPEPPEIAEPGCEAFWTNRIPGHEPWARIMMTETDACKDNKHTPEFTEYDDEKIGKVELDEDIIRGKYWRR